MKIEDTQLGRREFVLKTVKGSAVLFGLSLVGCSPLRKTLVKTLIEGGLETDLKNKLDAIAWFEITAKNAIILHSPKVEMGQGVFTGMAQMAAEELEVRVDQVNVVHASTKGRPIDPRSTGGSDSTTSLWVPLREMAANMREMLKDNAAQILGVSTASLTLKEGVISSGSKKMTYGEVVEKSTDWKMPKKVALKERKDFKVIGKEIPRVDLKPKVFGEPIFGMDVTMPGMLYGSVLRPPKLDTELETADTSAASKMPGVVKIVTETDFVGVIAQTHIQAETAKKAVKATWKTNKEWTQEEVLKKVKVGAGKPYPLQKVGNVKKHLEEGDIYTAEYNSPLGAHAHIEPNGAVVKVEGDQVFIKMSTQVPKYARNAVAERLGLKEEQVELEPTFLGGGFGRRLQTPNVVQAAVMSKAIKKPVHVFFDRKEEFQNGNFRPPTNHILKAKLNDTGTIEAIEHNTSSGDVVFGSPIIPSAMEGMLGADPGAWAGGYISYNKIPNIQMVAWRVKLPFKPGMWRGLGATANTFAVESFMDELAIKAGKDPITFRLNHLSNEGRYSRFIKVIETARDKAGWGKKMPDGQAQGFACGYDISTPVAMVADVEVKGKEIKVLKVTCVIDPGFIVNPDGVRAQCEGAINMSISATMHEKLEVKNGAIWPIIYGPYDMALIKHTPKEIDVVMLESGDRPTGVGEPPIGPLGAAVANAVNKITNQRLRDLPLKLA